MRTIVLFSFLLLSYSLSASDTLRSVLVFDYNGLDSVPVSKSVYKYRFGDLYKVYTYHWANENWKLASEAKYEYDTNPNNWYNGVIDKQTDYYIDGIAPYPRLLETYQYFDHIQTQTETLVQYTFRP